MDKIEHFTVFVQTVNHGSFSAVARLLDLTPSAVSRQIDRLEAYYKIRLFQRTSRALRLTSEGQLLYEQASTLLASLKEAESLLTSSAEVPSGLIRVHAPPTFGIYRLAPVTRDYIAKYPHVQIEYMLDSESIDLVSSGIDIDIRRGPMIDSSLVARKLSTFKYTICASPGYLKRRGTPSKPPDLLQHDCLNIAHQPELSNWPVEEDGVIKQIRVSSAVTASNSEMLKHLALEGVGIARISDMQVSSEIKTGRLVSLFPNVLTAGTDFFACYFRRKHLNARIRTYIDFVVDRLAREAYEK